MPEWVRWVAQDADGSWWAYEVEPLQHDTGWYENEVGKQIKIGVTSPNSGWRDTLRKRLP